MSEDGTALGGEIEVTTEMIRAGLYELVRYRPDRADVVAALPTIYQAMEGARRSGSEDHNAAFFGRGRGCACGTDAARRLEEMLRAHIAAMPAIAVAAVNAARVRTGEG